ncbi:MotA/TolQ/ExbB proton channel family protein [Aminipila sp.]|uniref:MotA/TolQ/ExbB proton channel family protein n=1 Tax=Aminipila sp. TaxID=2060095 RepID=UPI00289AB262|nr:MotA/TolQ/ExbB proton channel family protein [Aminipila sp.]
MGFGLSNILHLIGQILLKPCMCVLLLLMIVTVWQFGDFAVEFFTERRKRKKLDATGLLKKIHEENDLQKTIEGSGLPARQKAALNVLLESSDMPKTSLTALAQRLLATEEEKYDKAVGITDLVAKLGPMFGLLGTLIPLGPGIIALGHGDTETLSKSLAIAFDTTISGVISAAICCVISNIRKKWYEDYLITFELVMESMLEEVDANAKK